MSEQAGFLRAITEHPDEDAHRLVYADWLEEHGGEAHARLIRAQCALEGLIDRGEARPPFDASNQLEVMRLRPELRQALLRPFAHLLPQLGEPDDPPETVFASAFRCWVRRGFVEAVEVFGGQTASLFARDAARVLEQTPLLHLRIRPEATRVEGDPPPYAQVQMDALQARTLRAILEQEWVPRLWTLELNHHGLSDEAGRCLLRVRGRLNLRRLSLVGGMFSGGVRAHLQEQFGDALVLPLGDDDIPF